MSPADFAKLATVPTGSGLAGGLVSGAIDVAALSSGNIIAPAVSGYAFIPTRFGVHVVAVAGAMSTPPTITIKTGAVNWLAASVLFPGTATFAAGADADSNSAVSNNLVAARNTAMTVDISVAATGTGGFACTVKYWANGLWIPVP